MSWLRSDAYGCFTDNAEMALQIVKQWYFEITTTTSHETSCQAISQTRCDSSFWDCLLNAPYRSLTIQNSTVMGHLLGETKTAYMEYRSTAEDSIHTHIHRGQQDSSKHKNVVLELDHNAACSWVKKAETVLTWAFSNEGEKPEKEDFYLYPGSMGSKKEYLWREVSRVGFEIRKSRFSCGCMSIHKSCLKISKS